ncbi:putative BTB/POZ domain and WD-repeat protein [Acanthamoeba polyphaga mimivirus]|uniref:Putative BTB/POZ domain and WD-repeat protein n=1 Tax=Acanthamoeba polyphaga mimivirus TaxID=212035 RepID=A0A0G2Y902_MIMIV|nr:putative BTB/POZ domain and WD-repeat protein [Acanthamoeba polyphaga mimivirus]
MNQLSLKLSMSIIKIIIMATKKIQLDNFIESQNKLYSFTKEKLFTDVTIVLDDGNCQTTLDLHKAVLASKCTYFYNLFTKFSESKQSVIKINVANSYVTANIIASFYSQNTDTRNYPHWKYYLLEIMCLDFLGLEYDLEYFSKIQVPVEGFELLLDVVDIIGYTSDTIPIIARNLPHDYDFTKFPMELIEQLIKYVYSFDIILVNSNGIIDFFNIHGDKIKSISTFFTNNDIKYYTSHKINDELIVVFADNIVNVWNIKNSVVEASLEYPVNVKTRFEHFCYLPSNNHLISTSSYNIYVWDLSTNKLIKTVKKHKNTITGIHVSPIDDSQFVTIGRDDRICIWNAKTYNIVRCMMSPVDCICYLFSGCELVIVNKYYIKVFNVFDGTFLFKMKINLNKSPNNIINSSYGKYIINYDAYIKIFYYPPNHLNDCTDIYCPSNYTQGIYTPDKKYLIMNRSDEDYYDVYDNSVAKDNKYVCNSFRIGKHVSRVFMFKDSSIGLFIVKNSLTSLYENLTSLMQLQTQE